MTTCSALDSSAGLGGAPVNGCQTGRDTGEEALSGLGQGRPGAGATRTEGPTARSRALPIWRLTADCEVCSFARRQGEVARAGPALSKAISALAGGMR